MVQSIIQVDAFTNQPFRGNPAAICVLEEPRTDTWMQLVAREMNLAETAFLRPQGTRYQLRWFTPAAEVDLCGHATLASAHVLWEEGLVRPDSTIEFDTRSGRLSATQSEDWITLDFPVEPAVASSCPDALHRALGVPFTFVGRNRMDYLIEVENEAQVRELAPDMSLMKTMQDVRGVIVTSRSNSDEFDFVSRFFAPWVGVDEDPVTGSAHCCLGPYWQQRLGMNQFRAYQASERGGVIGVVVEGERVKLRGQAVTVLRGTLIE